MAPLQLILSFEFDEKRHTIDKLAHKYLEQASKSVQHLLPIETLGDGNCLFNSIVSLAPNSEITAIELRGSYDIHCVYITTYLIDKYNVNPIMISVRTAIELVKNKTHYVNRCSQFVGPFDEALRRICNNNSFCELYEVVALANVLNCEVQSVYPYIDYRAEMKIMNAIFQPTETSTSSKRRVIIFWTNTEDEHLTKARPGCQGIWSPNHFVPLVQRTQPHRTASIDHIGMTLEVSRTQKYMR